MRVVFLLLGLVSAYSIQSGSNNAVQKVVQLMQDMLTKGTAEKQEEQTRFAAFKQWCDGTTVRKQDAIAVANDEIEELQADVSKADADAAVLAQEIAKLEKDIEGWTSDIAEAKKIRATDKADFEATHADYSESVDALGRAINVLKRQNYDRKQAESLLQTVVAMNKVPAEKRRRLEAFIQTKNKGPDANAYEFGSGSIVDMLKGLQEQFWDERAKLEKEEMNAQHAQNVMVLDLENSIKAATASSADKAGKKKGREEDSAAGRGDLADTTASRDEDTIYLNDMVAQCRQKSSDFEQRQQLRTEEQEAINKAIEIISSGVAGHAQKHLALAQTSFALRASRTSNPSVAQAAALLQKMAEKLQSKDLALLADSVAANPFAKVKKMVDAMITRLITEANEEAEQKGWCDKEMNTNKFTRDEKSAKIDELSAQSDKLTADIARLTQQIADLQAGIAEIDAAVAEATKQRAEEKEKNTATIKDSQDAQTACSQALQVLKDFYAKAATATAFVQGPADDAPETFEGAYQGNQGAKDGVLGLLESIGSDFAQVEAETEASEATSKQEHKRFLVESDKDKAVKEADLSHKQQQKTGKAADLVDATGDLKATQRQLQVAVNYYERLKPQCVAQGVSYEERVAQREEEIESLKDALSILSNV